MLRQLTLSLQFALPASLALHRAALPRHTVHRTIRHALEHDAQITVRVVDTHEGRTLNRDYRQRDYATNVLTFSYAADPLMADIVLCAPVVAQEALAQGKSLQAHYVHLLVHGSLHAQGWEHEAGRVQARTMEAREISVLARLGFPNPYL